MRSKSKYTITEDGIRIRYIRTGKKCDKSLVFVHGLGENLESWKYQIEYFSKLYNVVAIDLRGFGFSETPKELSSIYDYVLDVHSVITKEKIKKIVLCGLSMGGLVSIAFYDRYPEIVSGLILADTTAYYPKSVVDEILPKRVEIIEKKGLIELAKMIANSALISAGEHDRDLIMASISSVNKEYYKKALEITLRTDLRHVLPSINVPTLIIVGEHDKTTPVDLALEMKKIRNSDLKIVKNAGHISKMDNPEEFNSYIREFLEKISWGC